MRMNKPDNNAILNVLSRLHVCTFAIAAGNRCLEAFTVALDAASDGEQWYTSTVNLQLASLPLCVACRDVATLDVRVDMLTPRSLWDPEDQYIPRDACGRSNTRTASRVPPVRPRGLRWERPVKFLQQPGKDSLELEAEEDSASREMLSQGTVRSGRLFDRVRCMVFGRDFNYPIDAVIWPPNLQQLHFGYSFDQPIDKVIWPTSLEKLIFGEKFAHPIEHVVFAASLISLTLGFYFDHPIDAVIWPASLQQLTFVCGSIFNQPVDGVRFPASLKRLDFGHSFNQALHKVLWPASLEQLTLGAMFNQTMNGVVWPVSLQQLTFGQSFDQPIAREPSDFPLQERVTVGSGDQALNEDYGRRSRGVYWPDSLQRLTFGYEFNQPIDRVSWPTSLRQLTFGCRFNRKIHEVTWPPLLQQLTFVGGFNQAIDRVVWPVSLRRLSFGNYFDQRLTGVKWPTGLEELRLRNPRYSHSLKDVRWPIGLRRLVVRSKLKKIESIKLPRGSQLLKCDG